MAVLSRYCALERIASDVLVSKRALRMQALTHVTQGRGRLSDQLATSFGQNYGRGDACLYFYVPQIVAANVVTNKVTSEVDSLRA